jgi:hypothetical protein
MPTNFGLFGLKGKAILEPASVNVLERRAEEYETFRDQQISTLLYLITFELIVVVTCWLAFNASPLAQFVKTVSEINFGVTFPTTLALDHVQTSYANRLDNLLTLRRRNERQLHTEERSEFVNNPPPPPERVMAESYLPKKRNRNSKEIKSDIAKLSKKKQVELVRELYQTYLEQPVVVRKPGNNRMADLDIVTESDLDKEEKV